MSENLNFDSLNLGFNRGLILIEIKILTSSNYFDFLELELDKILYLTNQTQFLISG